MRLIYDQAKLDRHFQEQFPVLGTENGDLGYFGCDWPKPVTGRCADAEPFHISVRMMNKKKARGGSLSDIIGNLMAT